MSNRNLYHHKRNPLYRDDYRPSEYKIDAVNLYINLDEECTEVTSVLNIKRNPDLADLGGPLILDGEEIILKSIELFDDGEWCELNHQGFFVTDKNLIIKRPPEGEFQLRIKNEFSPKENTKLEGVYKAGDSIMSQCEAQGFRRITYYLDRPDNLAAFDVTLEGDKAKYPILLSNGNGDYKDTKDLGNGRHSVQWLDPHLKPSYLFAVVAGDLKVLEDSFATMSGKNVDLRIFVDDGYENKVSWAMESIKRSMKWDEDTYGREYDLDCFHVVATSKFNFGAMENKGLNIFNISALVGSADTSTDERLKGIEAIIGHEYFHNWTGDRVTCRDWFQLTLKEGLTVLRDRQFTADMHSAAIKTIDDALDLRAGQFNEDKGPTSHPIRPDMVEVFGNIYSSTVYDKGSHVLGMIHTIVGQDKWRKAMDNYFDKFDGQAVTCDDFIDNMAEVTGTDLSQFRLWYKQSGTPEISYESKYDADKKVYSITIKQDIQPTVDQKIKENLHIPIRVGLIGGNGNDVAERLLNLTEAAQTFTFENIGDASVVPSVLRGFSAPVKIVTNPSDEELVFRMAHDSDPYNKYEAAERFKLKTVYKLIEDYKAGNELKLDAEFIDAYKVNFKSALSGDKEFAAEILNLPFYSIVEQGLDKVDPYAIYDVLKFIKTSLAEEFKDELLNIYNETFAPEGEVYDVIPEQAGRRKLHNTSLDFLSKLETDDILGLLKTQYQSVDNMTERLGGLAPMVNLKDQSLAKESLSDFYDHYKDDTNVVDTWLRFNVARKVENPIDNVNELLEHEAFDWTNPNKVRALVGGFVGGNIKAFHDMNASGYKFLSDVIVKLNSLNPAIGARLASILADCNKYEDDRKKLIVAELERIMETPELDAAIKEIVGKGLDQAKG